MAGGHVAYEKRGPLAIIRLERPEALNALTYPMITGVERYAFAAEDDPDDHLVTGGLLLMAELNCTACHAVPEAWQERLNPKPAPDLSAVGSRLDEDTLWLMIRSPQHRKKGTQMPGLFAGEEGDDEKAEALVEYLASLKAETPKMPAGDSEHGKELYHKVGCVACHEPALDVRPPKVPADAEVEKPGNASVPIALADAYEFNALAAFLKILLRRLLFRPPTVEEVSPLPDASQQPTRSRFAVLRLEAQELAKDVRKQARSTTEQQVLDTKMEQAEDMIETVASHLESYLVQQERPR